MLLPLLFLEADEDEVSGDEKRTLDEHAVRSKQVILLSLTQRGQLVLESKFLVL